jgi:8-amino-7-oxononanoate synthase
VIDFTSAHYLGLEHGSLDLARWVQLTTGRPAALEEYGGARSVARRLAELQGCEHATLGTSTLHLFWDLCGQWADEGATFFVDAGVYPVVRWGVERAAARGAAVRFFRHYDPSALLAALSGRRVGQGRPVVLADGFCPACGRTAPLAGYLETVRPQGGYLVVDDTQALGIHGAHPSRSAPYGLGGGGSLRQSGAFGPDLIVIASLAKAFAAPLAALSGSSALINRFEERSATRVHCSPPSITGIHAAARALRVNSVFGDRMRRHLLALIAPLRAGAARLRIRMAPGLFPVQRLVQRSWTAAARLHGVLGEAGLRTLLSSAYAPTHYVALSLTAGHQATDVEQVLNVLARTKTHSVLEEAHHEREHIGHWIVRGYP